MGQFLFGKRTMDYEDNDFSSKVYKDSKGFDTIGIGHKLTADEIKNGTYKNGVNREQAYALFNKDKQSNTNKFYGNHPKFLTYPKSVRNGLEDIAFNMGPQFLNKFPTMKKELYGENFPEAATQLLTGSNGGSSGYEKDVGQRARDNAMRIASGYDQKFIQQNQFNKAEDLAENNLGLGGKLLSSKTIYR